MANATTYYVDQAHGSASDSNACTSLSLPCLTLAGGIGKLSSGDTLILKAGTYDDRITTLPSGASWATATTIQAATGETVTFTGGMAIDDSYIIFQDLKFTTLGASVNAGDHIRFVNIDSGPMDDDSLLNMGANSSYNEVLGGTWHGASYDTPACSAGGGGDSCYAFYISGSNNLIDGIDCYDNPSFCIHNYNGGGLASSNNTYRNNTIHDNGLLTSHTSAGILIGTGDSNIAYNNIIYDNGMDGIEISNNSSNSKIYNNTIVGNNTRNLAYGGIVWGNDTGSLIKNNISYGNTAVDMVDSDGGSGDTPTASHNFCSSSCPIGTNNQSGDPLFVNQAGADFHLGAASDAIDAGTDLSAIFTTDYDGTTRSGTWDIGAFNYGSTPQIDALVLSLDFNEGSGLPQDSSGYGNHVTALGSGNSWSSGHTGSGVTFGGSAAATIADSNSLDLATGFTLQAWIKQTNSPTDFAAVMAKDKTSSPDHVYWLYAAGHADYCANNGPMGGYTEPSNTWACYETAITANVWTHLAVTYDSTLGSSNLKLFVNGSQVATANGTDTLNAGTGTMLIGGTPFGEYFTGIIDDLKVYNYARTAEQICTDGCGVAARQVGPIFLFY